jgi:hypothetical protein
VLCAVAAAVLFFAGAASGETYKVSDLAALERILSTDSNPGDVVEVQPGTYFVETAKIEVLRSGTPDKPVVIRGVIKDGQRPVLDASKFNIQRGIFYIEEQVHDVVIENLEFCNAWGGGRAGKEQPRNAAGVYILGSNITLRNCKVHHCENGLFSTHESDFVLIDNCDIGFNGRELGVGERFRTHNFYFNSKHQMVVNSYIHDATDSENFKSRGTNNIFAFNWVDEELAYSLGVDSGNEENTLWLGNVAIKRTYEAIGQGRLLGVGDGTGVAKGTLVALNNTFITTFPRDFYLFTEETSTCNVILINNVFAGPGTVFLEKNGKGTVTGRNNAIQKGISGIPDELMFTRSSDDVVFFLTGDDPPFVDAKALDFRPKAGSPLVDAGVSPEEYEAAVKIVTQYSRGKEGAAASREWLAALEKVERGTPSFSPLRKAPGASERKVVGKIDIGAYESTGPGN